MKKKYSLNYEIESDKDRLEAVRQILDELDSDPNPSDLEQMASYILYGKSEDGLNEVQRGNIDDRETRRYGTYRTADERVTSLDELLENPLADQMNMKPFDAKRTVSIPRPKIERPKYNKQTGELIDIGDADIPGMIELWDNVKRLEHTYLANEGKVEFTAEDSIISDPYRLWQLKHMIVDLRRHQYYLKDMFKPTIHFLNIQPTPTPTFNFDSDSFYWMTLDQWKARIARNYRPDISNNLEDYERRENPFTGELEVKWIVRRQAFDWENAYHIKKLIDFYSDIYMQNWDKVDSWGRTLIYDFDRYITLLHLTPAREYMLMRKIDKATMKQIRDELQEKFGLNYKEQTISTIIYKDIPNAIIKFIQREKEIRETPDEMKKKCSMCGRMLPATPLFYIRNKSKRMGIESACKECQKRRRIEQGRQTDYDRRNKEEAMLEVQAAEANL